MMKEAALETLASLAISSQVLRFQRFKKNFFCLNLWCSKLHFPWILQEDSAYIYDSVMPYLKIILETATKDRSRTLLAKSMECITMVTMDFGNQAIHGYVEKVNTIYIFPLALSRHYINVTLSTYLKMHLPHVMCHFRSL